MKYLFLDLEENDYEFFKGELYSSGDVEDVYNGFLAIIDVEQMKMMIVNDNKTQEWIDIIISKVRTNAWKRKYPITPP